ncbi:hypothetical protein D3C75_685260 [compost metagenome]
MQFVDDRTVRTVAWIKQALNFVAHAQVKLLSPGTLLQRETARCITGMDVVQVNLAIVQPFTQRATVVRLMHFAPGFPHALQRTGRICSRSRWRGVFVALNTDDVGHQHGVVRGYRTAGLGDHRWVWQAVFFTRITNRPDNIVCVFVQAIVDRTI